MSAAEYLVGRVESGGAGAATIEAGALRLQRAQGDHIVMREGDKLVRIRVAPAVIVGETIDGRWGELAGHRLAALFDDVAPGDHVSTRLTGAAIRPGDHVAVRVRRDGETLIAERVAYGTDDAALMRALAYAEAADRDTQAAAQREATATAVRDERVRTTVRPPWGRTTVFIGALALGAAGLAALGSPHLWALAAGLGGATLMLWSTRHDLRHVHRVAGTQETASRQLTMFWQVMAAFLAVVVAYGGNKYGPRRPNLDAGLVVACVIPGIAAVVGLVRALLGVRALWPLERAARLAIPPPPRTWGVIEGVVAGPGTTPVLAATTTRFVQATGRARGGWIWEDRETLTTAAHTFELDTGSWRAQVITDGMIWAAPAAWQPLDRTKKITAIAAVRPGDRVRVLARTGEAGEGELRAGGPESLFLVAGSPSAIVRRALRPPVMIAAYVAAVIASTLL